MKYLNPHLHIFFHIESPLETKILASRASATLGPPGHDSGHASTPHGRPSLVSVRLTGVTCTVMQQLLWLPPWPCGTCHVCWNYFFSSDSTKYMHATKYKKTPQCDVFIIQHVIFFHFMPFSCLSLVSSTLAPAYHEHKQKTVISLPWIGLENVPLADHITLSLILQKCTTEWWKKVHVDMKND